MVTVKQRPRVPRQGERGRQQGKSRAKETCKAWAARELGCSNGRGGTSTGAWGENLRWWREDVQRWSRKEFCEQVEAMAHRMKEARGINPRRKNGLALGIRAGYTATRLLPPNPFRDGRPTATPYTICRRSATGEPGNDGRGGNTSTRMLKTWTDADFCAARAVPPPSL